MKNKKEQIEEIMKIIANGDLPLRLPNRDYFIYRYIHSAKDLYSAGYRKATEVIDEFVERFKRRFFFMMATNMESSIYQCTGKEIEKLAAEMRQEVEK